MKKSKVAGSLLAVVMSRETSPSVLSPTDLEIEVKRPQELDFMQLREVLPE